MISTQCKKMVKDMIYEARIQAVITIYANVRKMKVTKKEARNMWLTMEQYCSDTVNMKMSLLLLLIVYNLTLTLMHFMCR